MRKELLSLWPTESDINACIKSEAETIDEAVLLAIHQPMQFLRRDVGAGGLTVSRTEEDLLAEFLQPRLPEGRLILPIVGSSGIGKSHVIRWLEAQLKRRPDAKRHHIIRVPKGSSLKGVLRLLLQDLSGPEFDRIRETLSSARDHLDPEKAARQLQLSLRYRLEQEAKAAYARIRSESTRTNPQLDEELRTYGDSRMLPALLGDPLLEQKHWLLRPYGKPGVLTLLAEQVTQDGGRDVDDRRHEFIGKDLNLDESIDVAELSAQARNCYRYLAQADGQRREAAARIMNRVLDEAKNDLLQLGDNSLVELFADVRAELYRQKRELVFLVEDFAVLSGIQGALLQVMITEATRDGKQRLCNMRSALAYTDGYMAGKDTVLTRARSEWVLSDHPGSDGDTIGRIERLVGAYLNAARVGQEKLKEAFQTGAESHRIPTVDIPNSEPEVRSILEAFGRSIDGYLLFPFNAAVIAQLAKTGASDSKGILFNPRFVINNVLRKVLSDRSAFEQGTFPSRHLANKLRSSEVTNWVARRVPGQQLERYLGVLELWGNQPDSIEEAAFISKEIYSAFGLEPIDFGVQSGIPARGVTSTTTRAGKGALGSPQSIVASAPDSAVTKLVQNDAELQWKRRLEDWSTGQILSQADARQLRTWIAEALLSFIPVSELLWLNHHKSFKVQGSVFIPGARGDANVSQESAFIVAVKSNELETPVGRANAVRLLMAFVRRYEVHKSWDYDGAEIDGGLVHRFLADRAPAAVAYMRARHRDESMEIRQSLVSYLLVSARVLGRTGIHDRSSKADLLDAMFAVLPEPPQEAVGAWVDLQRMFLKSRKKVQSLLLEMVGARQGTGAKVHAVDAHQLLPAMDHTRASWQLDEYKLVKRSDDDYKEFDHANKELRIRLEKIIREEHDTLLRWQKDADEWFGGEADKSEVQQRLRSLVSDVKLRGLTPEVDFEALQKALRDLPTMALTTARDAASKLKDNPSRGEVLSILSSLPGRDISRARDFVSLFERFFKALERSLEAKESTLSDSTETESANAVRDELLALDQQLSQYEA